MVNYFQDDNTHARVYVAGAVGHAMGRAGFMVGSVYMPITTAECQDFVNISAGMTSQATQL